MLDSHPDLSWFHDFDWATKYIAPDGNWPTLDEYQAHLKEDFAYQFWNLDLNYGNPSTYPDVLNGFLEQRRERDQKPISGATVHTRFAELPKIWPQAKFIHILRDPRDVAHSTIKYQWNGNVWGAVQRWKEAELEWNKLCAIAPQAQRMEFKFEELIANPVETLQRMTDFLGVPYTEAIFSYIEKTPYGYPDPRRVYQWRKHMPAGDLEMAEAALGDLLTQRGYEKVTSRKAASALEELNWEWSDRLIKFRWRFDRYGWKLWLSQFMARRLGYPPQLAWAVKRVQELDVSEVQARSDFIADPNASPRKPLA